MSEKMHYEHILATKMLMPMGGGGGGGGGGGAACLGKCTMGTFLLQKCQISNP